MLHILEAKLWKVVQCLDLKIAHPQSQERLKNINTQTAETTHRCTELRETRHN